MITRVAVSLKSLKTLKELLGKVRSINALPDVNER